MSLEFSKKDINHYLYLLAKEYKKHNRNNPNCELVLVGGSSITLNYSFRDTTTDIDTIFYASSNIKESILKISEEYGLSSTWINDDFKKTESYSNKITEHSKFYKKFYGCMEVRTIKDEYLIAVKAHSYRNFKSDISDIIGIIKENKEMETGLNAEQVFEAYKELYNTEMPDKIKKDICDTFNHEDIEELYIYVAKKEKENLALLKNAEKKYKDALNKNNVNSFIKEIHICDNAERG